MSHVHHMTDTKAAGFHEVTVIEGSARRRSWSREEKARIVAESFDPVVSVSAVARRHGLNPNQLFTWRRQFRDEMEIWPADGGEAGQSAATSSGGVIELLVAGVRVRVDSDVDAAALRRVLQVVRTL